MSGLQDPHTPPAPSHSRGVASSHPSDSEDEIERLLSEDLAIIDAPIDPLKWWLFNIVIPLVILGIGAATVAFLGTVEPSQRPEPDDSRAGRIRLLPAVRTARIQSLRNTGRKLHLEVDGVVVPFREAAVAAEVAGRVIEKSPSCEAGQYVTAGALLMKIDPTDYELEIKRLSRAQQAEYEALLEVDQETVNTKRLVEVAEQDFELQEKELDRQKQLPAGFASQKDIDLAQRSVLAAQQQLVTLKNQLESQKARRTRLESSEQLVAAQLTAAKLNLERTRIVAPIDGVIVRENIDVDSYVNRGSLLLTIETTEKVEIDANLRSDQIYWVLNQTGATEQTATSGYQLPATPAIIQYEVSGLDDQVYRWNGTLVSYDGIGLDSTTRTVPVRIVVDNPRQNVDVNGNPTEASGAPALVRGMYVTVQLLIEPKVNLVVVPSDGLQPGNRVYEFVPDESVLMQPSQADESSSEIASESNADSRNLRQSLGAKEEPSDQAEEDAFNPDDWTPGRVVIQNRIIPIDSLSLGSGGMKDGEINASNAVGLADSRTYWVCHPQDENLTDGSWVVVSPLGDFSDEGISARAQLPKQIGSDLTAAKSK
jgi:multidrug efflux pump subunit AcrA (membrane-fusion protein)